MEESFEFVIRSDGTCDPPEWSVRQIDGSPFTAADCKDGRVELVLYHHGKKVGEGYLEPNPVIGQTRHYPWTAARAAYTYELDGE